MKFKKWFGRIEMLARGRRSKYAPLVEVDDPKPVSIRERAEELRIERELYMELYQTPLRREFDFGCWDGVVWFS